jgi:hypothetical protein
MLRLLDMKTLTKTQQLALDWIGSGITHWSDFCATRKIGAFGSTPEAWAIRLPPRASFERLEALGLIVVRDQQWVAR